MVEKTTYLAVMINHKNSFENLCEEYSQLRLRDYENYIEVLKGYSCHLFHLDEGKFEEFGVLKCFEDEFYKL